MALISAARACLNCGGGSLKVFYETCGTPVHSVLLMQTREEALSYPRGDIRLALCESCGFISNLSFDPAHNDYSSRYEETQGFSPTFNAFHRRLAECLIEKHGLRGKKVLEIGCGKGEFLLLLCQLGGNQGLGFDPSYIPGRLAIPEGVDIQFVTDLYSEKYGGCPADFVCCKMTLEHIHKTGYFVSTVRQALKDQPHATVFFQVPDAERVLRDAAFWDVYYEHCSYFTSASLAAVFRTCGFDVLDIEREYDGQYLTIAARAANGRPAPPPPVGANDTGKLAASFAERCRRSISAWRRRIAQTTSAGGRVVLWGGGSKAVAFLHAVDTAREVEYVVDINPNRQGTFIAGSAQQIVSPEFLREYRPQLVIVMNPVYREEIRGALNGMGLAPALETV